MLIKPTMPKRKALCLRVFSYTIAQHTADAAVKSDCSTNSIAIKPTMQSPAPDGLRKGSVLTDDGQDDRQTAPKTQGEGGFFPLRKWRSPAHHLSKTLGSRKPGTPLGAPPGNLPHR